MKTISEILRDESIPIADRLLAAAQTPGHITERRSV